MLHVPDPTVIFQRLGDGAVLFSPKTEIYFGLNEVGARIWELMPQARGSVDDIVRVLVEQFPDAPEATIRGDVAELLEDLQRAGLVLVPGSSTIDGSTLP